MNITFGTRGSALARWQTDMVAAKLQRHFPALPIEKIIFTTRGDKELSKPLPEIGGKGLFTAELESALRNREIDLAVHSLKDLPTDDPRGLTLGAILPRENPADALVSRNGYTLDTLPHSATIGTSSLRRAAQLLAHRPDLKIISLRGNVDTRVKKALNPTGEYTAIVLATAGLNRMALSAHITQIIPIEIMLPAPGQGAVAVQCRADDAETLSLLAKIHHEPTQRAVTAERAFLAGLGGGCSIPVGAIATLDGDLLQLEGMVATPDGTRMIRLTHNGTATHAEQIGMELAQMAIEKGAADILGGSYA